MYTREAHPGDHLEAHGSFDEKLAAARRLREELGIARPILVDDLGGAVHTVYGLLPNMSWVLARGGTVLYKAEWTSAERIGEFVQRRSSASRADRFYTEQFEPRVRDVATFKGGLARNGPRAIAEFARAEGIWKERSGEGGI